MRLGWRRGKHVGYGEEIVSERRLAAVGEHDGKGKHDAGGKSSALENTVARLAMEEMGTSRRRLKKRARMEEEQRQGGHQLGSGARRSTAWITRDKVGSLDQARGGRQEIDRRCSRRGGLEDMRDDQMSGEGHDD